MKILFLDVDGVLNCKTTNFKTSLWPFDRHKAFLVGRILDKTDAKLVLSSSWRHHPDGVATVEKHVFKVYDKTPVLSGTYNRGYEIKAWLDDHPGVEKYAILDDDDDMIEGQVLFQTTWEEGLTEEIADQIIKYLLTPK